MDAPRLAINSERQLSRDELQLTPAARLVFMLAVVVIPTLVVNMVGLLARVLSDRASVSLGRPVHVHEFPAGMTHPHCSAGYRECCC